MEVRSLIEEIGERLLVEADWFPGAGTGAPAVDIRSLGIEVNDRFPFGTV